MEDPQTAQAGSHNDNIEHNLTQEEVNNGDGNVREESLRQLVNAEKEKIEQGEQVRSYLKEDRRMRLLDVVTLNLNSMIGTGIYTTPGLILALTRSKIITLIFYLMGGIYSMLGVYIYNQYSNQMPFNGGEFLWLDAVFKRPKYLFAITVAGFFLALDISAGNCLAFAKEIALMRDPNATRTEQFNRDTITYLAVSVLTLVCFIHFFSPRLGFVLNRYFAFFKVAFLVAVIVAGISAGFREGSGRNESWIWHNDKRPPLSDVFSAFLFIIYSYTGWQTAYYVAGEVGKDDKPKKQDLARGSFFAVIIVTILYILTAAAYCLAIPVDLLIGDHELGGYNDLTIIVNFLPRAFNTNNTNWAKLFIAFSALGFLISSIYAHSKLNQKIFRQRFFPFYQLCDRDHPYYISPMGGLVVHWFFSVLNIVVAPNTPGGYGFIINVVSYGSIAITGLLGIGVFFIHTVGEEIGNEKPTKPRAVAAGALLAVTSIFLLVISAMGHGYPVYWLWPVALAVVVAVFGIYWTFFRLLLWYTGSSRANSASSKIRIYVYRHETHTADEEGSLPLLPELQETPEEVTARKQKMAIILDELNYRWEMWGETRLIVYEWSKPVQKKLQKLYTFLGMPHETQLGQESALPPFETAQGTPSSLGPSLQGPHAIPQLDLQGVPHRL